MGNGITDPRRKKNIGHPVRSSAQDLVAAHCGLAESTERHLLLQQMSPASGEICSQNSCRDKADQASVFFDRRTEKKLSIKCVQAVGISQQRYCAQYM
jgi:hypothetical protein